MGPPPPASRPIPPPISRPRRRIADVVDADEATLLEVLDNLLEKGVVLNAELILALANVDLIYVGLSAVVCAADRVLPRADE
ncbi:MAG: gas vesicle protein [Acidobacteria bacterium]|nr:gas vesicle protein [Acidobacteriota bacterium]